MPKAILYDATLCIDCKQCEQACAQQNKNPYDDAIAEARKRIAAEPGKYVPTIYGLNEVGGTSVLILSSVPVEKFGYPPSQKYGERPLPPLTADMLEHVPQVVTVGWAVLGGIWWITNRRDVVASAQKEDQP